MDKCSTLLVEVLPTFSSCSPMYNKENLMNTMLRLSVYLQLSLIVVVVVVVVVEVVVVVVAAAAAAAAAAAVVVVVVVVVVKGTNSVFPCVHS